MCPVLLSPKKSGFENYATQLLKSIDAQFDAVAFDWVIQQAGGVPEILLSAAELGPELRGKSGLLKVKLADAYSKRIKRQHGASAISLLRILSLIHWVKLKGENNDFDALIAIVGNGIDPHAILNDLPALKRMGYVKERGDYVSVVPPLFAAAFVEEFFAAKSSAVCRLFDTLDVSSQKRMLERCIATDVGESDGFWEHVLHRSLGKGEQLLAHVDLLGYLARAVPMRTARFLELHIDSISTAIEVSEYSWKRSALIQTVREIAYSPETCGTGLHLLQMLALEEPIEKESSGAIEIFCECFVHWNSNFPMSYLERERTIRRLLGTNVPKERRLAAKVVNFVTVPPHHLSGYTVEARRLTQPPPIRYLREVHHYLATILDIRFGLIQDPDPWIAAAASDDFVRAFDERHLPPGALLEKLETLIVWQKEGKVTIDKCAIRERLGWVEDKYLEVSKKADQKEHAQKWVETLHRVRALIAQFDEGDFETRLVLALGTDDDSEWEEKNGKRVYAYEKRARQLAEEAVSSPSLVTSKVLQHLESQRYHLRANFIIPLGELDENYLYFERLVENAEKTKTSYVLGLYLRGVHQRRPSDAEIKSQDLFNRADFDKALLPEIIRLVGPTDYNRETLNTLIDSNGICPLDLGRMFTRGRWLDDLPTVEVLKILECIHSGAVESRQLLPDVLNLYLHPGKALPRELMPFVERLLSEIRYVHHNEEHRIHRIAISIAKTDLSIGFAFLRAKIDQWNKSDSFARTGELWMPFSAHHSNDLWHFLRKQDPERAYKELLVIDVSSGVRSELGLVLDLELHRDILLGICGLHEDLAVHFSKMISGAQKGFFPFAYAVMERFPHSEKLIDTFTTEAMYQTGYFGFDNDRFKQALDRIGDEIAAQQTPEVHLPWLENVRNLIRQSVRPKPASSWPSETLGWD